MQPCSISVLKVTWVRMPLSRVETQRASPPKAAALHSVGSPREAPPHSTSPGFHPYMPVEKEITRSCQPLQAPHRNYSHRGWGGRAADPFPPLKFHDSKQSSRQLERNGEEIWVRPDIHDIALWVEGVWSEISKALSWERQEKGQTRRQADRAQGKARILKTATGQASGLSRPQFPDLLVGRTAHASSSLPSHNRHCASRRPAGPAAQGIFKAS